MLQVTDRLLGSSPEEAARVVGAVSRRATVALALHDLPQPAEGGRWYRRRRDAYAHMTDAADVVVVASEHERDCLDRCRREAALPPLRAGRVVVVPLPIEPRLGHPAPRGVQEDEVGVLGYLYPGKGVEEVVAAAARIRRAGRRIRVTCLGAPAEGHAEHAAELVAGAQRAGVPFRVTGFVPDDVLGSRLRTVGVPVAPHRHISASGSINAWLEAGRRPTTFLSPYARELADRLPRALHLVDDLETGIIDVLDHPERTWLGSDVRLGPSSSEAARWHADILDDLAQDAGPMDSTATVFA
jgi:glycosyltransferase involved in cell wall biosynthesis